MGSQEPCYLGAASAGLIEPRGDHASVGFITEAPGPLLPAGSGLPGILARPTQGYVGTRSHPWLYPTRYGP